MYNALGNFGRFLLVVALAAAGCDGPEPPRQPNADSVRANVSARSLRLDELGREYERQRAVVAEALMAAENEAAAKANAEDVIAQAEKDKRIRHLREYLTDLKARLVEVDERIRKVEQAGEPVPLVIPDDKPPPYAETLKELGIPYEPHLVRQP